VECITDEKLYNYLDGEIDKTEEQEIEAHLSSCKRCLSLAKRLEFESAVVAKALRSEKVFREQKERAIQTLAKKRGWKLKEPLFFINLSLSPKIVVVLALLLGMSVISYSVLMKDAHIEVGAFFSSLSDFPSIVKTENFLSSASQAIRTANSIIGGMVSPKTALVFFISYVYFALLLLLLLSMSVPAFKVRMRG
jgi:hypothetical protein